MFETLLLYKTGIHFQFSHNWFENVSRNSFSVFFSFTITNTLSSTMLQINEYRHMYIFQKIASKEQLHQLTFTVKFNIFFPKSKVYFTFACRVSNYRDKIYAKISLLSAKKIAREKTQKSPLPFGIGAYPFCFRWNRKLWKLQFVNVEGLNRLARFIANKSWANEMASCGYFE